MTTIVIVFLVACLAYLIGWLRGFGKATCYFQALEVEAESDDFVYAQRENAEWQ